MKPVLSTVNFEGLLIGFVIDNVDPTGEGRVKVFIPQLMSNRFIDEDVEEIDYEINTKIIKNEEDFQMTPVKLVNYIWLRPINFINTISPKITDGVVSRNSGEYSVPDVGSSLFCFFLDSDPKKGYYIKKSPTIKGESISATNVYNSALWNEMTVRPYFEILREYPNGNIIEICNKEFNQSGNYFRMFLFNFEILIENNTRNKKMRFKTEKGHSVVINDKEGESGIEINTANGNSVNIDDEENIITINNSSGNKITITSEGISINSNGGLTINGDLTVKGSIQTDSINNDSHNHPQYRI